MANTNGLFGTSSDVSFPADSGSAVSPSSENSKSFSMDPVSSGIDTTKKLKDQVDADDKEKIRVDAEDKETKRVDAEDKERERVDADDKETKKKAADKAKSTFILSGAVIALIGGIFALTKKLREKPGRANTAT